MVLGVHEILRCWGPWGRGGPRGSRGHGAAGGHGGPEGLGGPRIGSYF